MTPNAGYSKVINCLKPTCDIGIANNSIYITAFLYGILSDNSIVFETLYISDTSVENISSQIITSSII